MDCLPPAFVQAIHAHAPEIPLRVAAAQVRAESACNPQAMRRAPGELGCGWGQFTKAWTAAGRIRFDVLAELRYKYPQTLGGWTWERCTDVRYQYPAYALLMRDYRLGVGRWLDEYTRIIATVAAYNQGLYGTATRDRRLCAARPDCDPMQWFGHVERTCGASAEACRINRRYVTKVHNDAPTFAAQEEKYVVDKTAHPSRPAADPRGGAGGLATVQRFAASLAQRLAGAL